MTNFKRNAPAIGVFFIGSIAMAVIYAVLGEMHGSTVLPESYGPLVYAMPALAWAGLQAAFAGLGLFGVLFGLPTVTAIGAWLLGGMYVGFAVAAIYGGLNEVTLVAMAWPSAAMAWLSGLVAWGGRNGG